LHGQTNSQAQGDTQEFTALNEKVSKFDIWLRVKKGYGRLKIYRKSKNGKKQ